MCIFWDVCYSLNFAADSQKDLFVKSFLSLLLSLLPENFSTEFGSPCWRHCERVWLPPCSECLPISERHHGDWLYCIKEAPERTWRPSNIGRVPNIQACPWTLNRKLKRTVVIAPPPPPPLHKHTNTVNWPGRRYKGADAQTFWHQESAGTFHTAGLCWGWAQRRRSPSSSAGASWSLLPRHGR